MPSEGATRAGRDHDSGGTFFDSNCRSKFFRPFMDAGIPRIKVPARNYMPPRNWGRYIEYLRKIQNSHYLFSSADWSMIK
jgi:hypothetical protein